MDAEYRSLSLFAIHYYPSITFVSFERILTDGLRTTEKFGVLLCRLRSLFGSLLACVHFFMNHNPCKKDACRPIATSEISADGLTLEFRTGETALETGEELFYCCGESLSIEVLLHACGFALPDNQFDMVSVQISNDNYSATSSLAFCIPRGGVCSVPNEMWKAIAGVASSSEHDDDAIEIGSDDLERLLQYMSNKLEQLDRHKSDLDRSTIADPLTNERLKYIEICKGGQREILEAMVDDLKIMVEQSAED